LSSPLFSVGLSPVGTVLGETLDSRLGIGWSRIFAGGNLTGALIVKIAWSRIACPDSGSGLVLCQSRTNRGSPRISCFPSAESKLPFLNSFPTASFVSLEDLFCEPWEVVCSLSEPFLERILDLSRRTGESEIFSMLQHA
jgi:hypothetical protein